MLVTRQTRLRAYWCPIGRTENTQDYYVVREASDDFSTYWEPSSDPDGNLRNRLSDEERKQHLDDVTDELAFINTLTPGRILDYGAGPGWLLAELPDTWEKHAVEVSAPCATAPCPAWHHGLHASVCN